MKEERSAGSKPTHRIVLLPDVERLAYGSELWHPSPEPRGRALLRDAVREAVAKSLTDKQREVVEAYFFEGLSQPEIAARLGVSQQVVSKRIFGSRRDGRVVGGALKRLRRALSSEVGQP